MKNLLIEWRHFDKDGNTCQRCSKTGIALYKAIEELKKELDKQDISIAFKETKLPEGKIKESNSILLNGILLEELLENTKSVETACESCCEMIGTSVNCKALDCCGQTKEDISVELIKKAVRNLLRKDNK